MSTTYDVEAERLNFRYHRITMEDCGQAIHHFRSREEFIYAFRDAVAGHQNLWEAGILHRDVSVNNVLIQKPNAKVGNRGVLIDLDMAILPGRDDSLASVDFRTGTRAFQSISVLSNVNDTTGQAVGHDYLDDLESFFYILCWVTLGYAGPKEPLIGANRPHILVEWDQDDARAAANSKKAMIISLSDKVTPYFGPTFQKLLTALHRFLRPIMLDKIDQRDNFNIPRPHLEDLKEPAKAQYAAVLDIIDRAILHLESEPLNTQHTTTAPVTPTRTTRTVLTGFPATSNLSHTHSDSSLKRRAKEPDIIDDTPLSKKQKRRAYENEKKRAAEKGTTTAPVTPTRTTVVLPRFPAKSNLSHTHSGSSLKRQAEEPDIIDDTPLSKKQKRREYENEKKRAATKGSGQSGR